MQTVKFEDNELLVYMSVIDANRAKGVSGIGPDSGVGDNIYDPAVSTKFNQLFTIEFVLTNNDQSEDVVPGRSCTEEDFKMAPDVWKKYQTWNWFLICP